MKSFTPLLKYLGLFLLIYIILYSVCSMPSVAKVSANIYRTTTQPILQTIFPKAYLRLQPDKATPPNPHIIRAVYSSQAEVRRQTELAKQQGAKRLSMNAIDYELYFNLLFTTFFVFLISLVAVTPLGWKNKLIAMISGAVLFYLFTVFKIAIFLLDLFNKSTFEMYKLGSFGTNLTEGLSHLFKSLGFSSFVIVVIWGFVAFRKSNWRRFLSEFERK